MLLNSLAVIIFFSQFIEFIYVDLDKLQKTKQKKFEKLMVTMQEKREEAKRLAMAKIKATE